MDDLLWTVDGDSVQVRSKDCLSVIASFGTTGAGNANFNAPTHLAADLFAVYVNDAGNARVKKHVGTTLAYSAQATLASMSLPAVGPITVDRRRLLLGELATNTHVYLHHKNTFVEEHAMEDCGAGAVVGLAVINGYYFVADASRVEKRLLSDGSLVATWNTVPATFAVSGLTTDGTYVYVLCTKAVTDAKIVKLYAADLFESATGTLTGKQTPYALCCDTTSLFFTNVADTTVNRIDNDMDMASLASVADITTPRGICCLPPYFTALPAESVGSFSAAATVTPTLTSDLDPGQSFRASLNASPTLAATVSKVQGFSATLAAAPALATPVIKKVGAFAVALNASPGLAATVHKVAGFSASLSASPTLTAVVEKGTMQVGSYPAVQASLGTATNVAATVAW